MKMTLIRALTVAGFLAMSASAYAMPGGWWWALFN
jgi:hypothetical protein